MSTPRRAHATFALTLAVALSLATGSPASADEPAAAVTLIDNTGDSDVPTDPTYVPLVPDAGLTAQKMQHVAALRPQVAAMIAGVDPTSLCVASLDSSNCRTPIPSAKVLNMSSALRQQNTGYTCAPASAQSILAYLGIAATEPGLAAEMRTRESDGTYWVNLRDTLNRRQNHDEFIGQPEHGGLTPDELMSRVVYDVARVGNGSYHPAVLNVNQYRLSYWGNDATKNGRHYLVSHGYDTSNQGKLHLGDVAQSHFGRYTVSLANAHTAVVANKGLVLY